MGGVRGCQPTSGIFVSARKLRAVCVIVSMPMGSARSSIVKRGWWCGKASLPPAPTKKKQPGVGREVFARHDWRVVDQAIGAGGFTYDGYERRVVYDGSVALEIVEFVGGAVGCRYAAEGAVDGLARALPQLFSVRAHGAAELRRLRDDVVRGSSRDSGDRDDDAVERRGRAGYDMLQVRYRLGGDRDRIDRGMRECGMSASSKNPHEERIGCCRARAVEVRRQVAADDGVDAIEYPGLDQLGRATRREFFRVLEQKTHLAAQLGTHPTKQACRREQRRRMTIVPARVHDTLDARCELDSTLLLNRKGVHVGAQS